MGMAGLCRFMKRLLSAHIRPAVGRVTKRSLNSGGKIPRKSIKSAPSRASLNHQFFVNSAKWERVDHVLSSQPSFSGSPDAED